jgi:hypothetical protein
MNCSVVTALVILHSCIPVVSDSIQLYISSVMVSAHPQIASECGSFDAQRWKQVAQTAKSADFEAAIDSEPRVLVSN